MVRKMLQKLCIPLIFSLLLLSGCSPPKAPYPDTSLPGDYPEVFAEDVLPIGEVMHAAVTFGKARHEMFWHEIPPRLIWMRYMNGTWAEPRTPEFALEFPCLQPFFLPRSNRLYFASSRPGGEGGMDIWFVDHVGDTWGVPENAGTPINTDGHEMQPSLAANGTIYYVARIEGKTFERGIYRSRLSAGQYLLRLRLPEPVNLPRGIDYTPCIAPDESFLLFSSNRHRPEEEFCQIYVTFPQPDGSWSTPVNLCERVGFDQDARFPALSPDGRTLFFAGRTHMYWMSSAVIERIQQELTPSAPLRKAP